MTASTTVLITGGGQRIGLHCARRFVEDGFSVIVTCRRLREWTRQPHDGIEVIQADFSTNDGIHALVETLVERQVKLRALVHNASLWLPDESGADGFQQMFQVHMQAPYLINTCWKQLFEAGETGDIIHLSDHVARRGSRRHAAYCATKAGLEALAMCFAARLAPMVKVNSIAPALIMFNPEDDEEYRQRALAKSALGIEPGPEVVYQSIRYLMDNPYVTGTCLDLDGGRNLK